MCWGHTNSTMTTRMRMRCRFPRFSTLCSSVAVRPKNVFFPVCSTADSTQGGILAVPQGNMHMITVQTFTAPEACSVQDPTPDCQIYCSSAICTSIQSHHPGP